MSKINWKSKVDIEVEKAEIETKRIAKKGFKGIKKSELTQVEINELVLLIAEELGLL